MLQRRVSPAKKYLRRTLQVVALVSRTEAWHLTIEAAGGRVDRRTLYRASSVQILGGVINGHLGVAARIAALRRSSPLVSPQVPTLVAGLCAMRGIGFASRWPEPLSGSRKLLISF